MSGGATRLHLRVSRLAAIVIAAAAWPLAAHAVTDEIQVYNAEIAQPGQWTLEQHLNYAINGRKQPDFPGGFVSNHALNGTPELAYGVNDWYELGWYAPFTVDQSGQLVSDGFKFRQLWVVPDAAKREVFYGVNLELSYATPRFSDTAYGAEIRPIIGWRKGEWEFIVNPIVDLGFGRNGQAEFAPAARVARKFGDDLSFGLEYYSTLGPLGAFPAFSEQQHTVFGVVDFKVGRFDVDVGVGYGLTSGSDRLVTKLIIGTELNQPARLVNLPR